MFGTRGVHYGLQRSGTNYLESLLKNNFKVRLMNQKKDRTSILHKHVRIYAEKQVIPEPKYINQINAESIDSLWSCYEIKPEFIIVISKDPYSWYISYKRWAQKCSWPKVSHHYAEEYKLFYERWVDLSKASNNIELVRYADLLQDPAGVLMPLAKKLHIKERKTSRLLSFSSPRKVPESEEFSNDKADYYINKRYLNELADVDVAEINNKVGSTLMNSLGYAMEC